MKTAPSRRIAAVQTPIIPVVAEMIRRHPGTISLGQGVVSYGPPPQAAAQVARFFEDEENHKYKPVQGIAPLLDKIAEKLHRENNIVLERSEIAVTAGSNMGFQNALLAIADPGDEIILPAPFYFNHEMAIALANCHTVPVPTDENYQLDLNAIHAAITPRTRAIVTISPNNPSGAVYGEAALRQVNKLCRDNGLFHITDEAYEYFTFDGARHFSPGSIEGSADYTISLFSLSKANGFASWRIGYMVLPRYLCEAVRKIQDTVLICPPVISQFAALGALQAGREYCEPYLDDLREVRAFARCELETIGDFCQVPPANGAFYYLLHINQPINALELVEKLIREYGVAVIPGSTFGMSSCYLRVAYGALQKLTAQEGIGRLTRGLKAILR